MSCKKDDNSDPVISSTVTCSIDNAATTFSIANYSISDSSIAFANSDESILFGFMFKKGFPTSFPVSYDSNTDTLVIAIYEANDNDYIATEIVSDGVQYSWGSYKLTISNNTDSRIEGTFETTLIDPLGIQDSVVITNGVFKNVESD